MAEKNRMSQEVLLEKTFLCMRVMDQFRYNRKVLPFPMINLLHTSFIDYIYLKRKLKSKTSKTIPVKNLKHPLP